MFPKRSWFARAWHVIWQPSTRTPMAVLFLVGAVVTAGVGFAFSGLLTYSNSTEFCISCHEMKDTVYQDYLGSIHYKNPSGVRATCSDCHVPKDFLPKMMRKIMATRDVYHTILGTIDTPEKFSAKREELAGRVWAYMRANDSRECQSCHSFDAMKTAEQRPRAQTEHPDGIQDGKTCIDCHRGITHRLPPKDD